jgi:hypothetical protein
MPPVPAAVDVAPPVPPLPVAVVAPPLPPVPVVAVVAVVLVVAVDVSASSPQAKRVSAPVAASPINALNRRFLVFLYVESPRKYKSG